MTDTRRASDLTRVGYSVAGHASLHTGEKIETWDLEQGTLITMPHWIEQLYQLASTKGGTKG